MSNCNETIKKSRRRIVIAIRPLNKRLILLVSENLYRKIFIVNQRTASWESTCSPQDFHGQPIASDEISSVGAESHSGMELKTTEKATQTKLKGIHARVLTQWLPEDTSDAVLYFLTTCTALCRRGTLKWLLMSVIIDKRVSREPPHRRKHFRWLTFALPFLPPWTMNRPVVKK